MSAPHKIQPNKIINNPKWKLLLVPEWKLIHIWIFITFLLLHPPAAGCSEARPFANVRSQVQRNNQEGRKEAIRGWDAWVVKTGRLRIPRNAHFHPRRSPLPLSNCIIPSSKGHGHDTATAKVPSIRAGWVVISFVHHLLPYNNNNCNGFSIQMDTLYSSGRSYNYWCVNKICIRGWMSIENGEPRDERVNWLIECIQVTQKGHTQSRLATRTPFDLE